MAALAIAVGGTGRELLAVLTRELSRREGIEAAGLIPLVCDGPQNDGESIIPDGTPPSGWEFTVERGMPTFHELTADQRSVICDVREGGSSQIEWLVASDAHALPVGQEAAPEAGFGGLRVAAGISAELGYKGLCEAISQARVQLMQLVKGGELPLVLVVYSTVGGTGSGYAPVVRRALAEVFQDNCRLVEVIVTPLAFEYPPKNRLVAASSIAAERHSVRDRNAGIGGALPIVVGRPQAALEGSKEDGKTVLNAREGVLGSAATHLAYLVRDDKYAAPAFIDWAARLNNASADAAFSIAGYAEMTLPTEQTAGLLAARIAADVYNRIAPQLVSGPEVERNLANLLNVDGLVGQIESIGKTPEEYTLANFIFAGPSHREIAESLDPTRALELPTLPDFEAMFMPGPLSRVNPEEIILSSQAVARGYLGSTDAHGTTIRRDVAPDSLEELLRRLTDRICADVRGAIVARCEDLLDTDDTPRPLGVAPDVAVVLRDTLNRAASIAESAAERLDVERDKLAGQPSQDARDERAEATRCLRESRKRATAREYLAACQYDMSLSAWVMVLDCAAQAARRVAGEYRSGAQPFDGFITMIRSAEDASRHKADVAQSQLEYDHRRPATSVLPTDPTARGQLHERCMAGKADSLLTRVALRFRRSNDGDFELTIRHPLIEGYQPVVRGSKDDHPLFAPALAIEDFRGRLLEELRGISLVDVLTLEVRAWLAERGGNATAELVDEFLDDRLAELARYAGQGTRTTPDDAACQDRWEKLLYDARPPTDDTDTLGSLVADRFREALVRQSIDTGVIPSAYGAGILRVQLSLGVSLDSIDGHATLVDHYYEHHTTESRESEAFRPVHTSLGDRNAHQIEQFLRRDAAKFDRNRLLAPSVAALLDDVDAVRLVARLHAVGQLPIQEPDDPNDPARVVVERDGIAGTVRHIVADAWDLGEVCAAAVSGRHRTTVVSHLELIWDDYLAKLSADSDIPVRELLHEKMAACADTLALPSPPPGKASRHDRADLELVFWTLLKATDEDLGIERPRRNGR